MKDKHLGVTRERGRVGAMWSSEIPVTQRSYWRGKMGKMKNNLIFTLTLTVCQGVKPPHNATEPLGRRTSVRKRGASVN
jgi:hypothetical protein